MEPQVAFNWIVGVAGVLGGWTLKVIWDSIQSLRSDVKNLDTKMHDDFVRRDDFKDAVKDIKSDMKEGFNKIDGTLGLISRNLKARRISDQPVLDCHRNPDRDHFMLSSVSLILCNWWTVSGKVLLICAV